jgi:prophage regulatory protein
MTIAILRLPAVKTRCGLSRSTIYAAIARGEFPKQVALGARSVGWIEADIEAWLRGRIDESRKSASVNPPENRASI